VVRRMMSCITGCASMACSTEIVSWPGEMCIEFTESDVCTISHVTCNAISYNVHVIVIQCYS
jgi:hypothetical protein